MLKNQLFGVEVEMTGITREKAARLVAGVLGTTPSHPESNCYHTRTIADQAARKWKIMRDSSIEAIRNDGTSEPLDEYRVEFVTPPLNYSDIELLQNIIRKLRENGAKAHSSCGIHIHVDGANHTAVSLRRLVNFMTARQDLIYEALQIGDRESNWCHKLNKTLLDAMKKDKNLTKEKAQYVSAPMIGESPVSIECRVREIKELGSHDMFLADVLAVHADEAYMDKNNKFHLNNAGLLVYSHGEYLAGGRKVGTFGYSVKKKTNKRKK